MARISKEQQLANIHAQAKSDFDRIQSALRPERKQCLEDRRFYSIAGGIFGDCFIPKGPLGTICPFASVIGLMSKYG